MEDLENKILEQTNRAVEEHAICELTAKYLKKSNTLQAKIMTAFHFLKLHITSLIQYIKYKNFRNDKVEKHQVKNIVPEWCNSDMEIDKLPTDDINSKSKLQNEFIQNKRNCSGPQFYSLREKEERGGIVSKNEEIKLIDISRKPISNNIEDLDR